MLRRSRRTVVLLLLATAAIGAFLILLPASHADAVDPSIVVAEKLVAPALNGEAPVPRSDVGQPKSQNAHASASRKITAPVAAKSTPRIAATSKPQHKKAIHTEDSHGMLVAPLKTTRAGLGGASNSIAGAPAGGAGTTRRALAAGDAVGVGANEGTATGPHKLGAAQGEAAGHVATTKRAKVGGELKAALDRALSGFEALAHQQAPPALPKDHGRHGGADKLVAKQQDREPSEQGPGAGTGADQSQHDQLQHSERDAKAAAPDRDPQQPNIAPKQQLPPSPPPPPPPPPPPQQSQGSKQVLVPTPAAANTAAAAEGAGTTPAHRSLSPWHDSIDPLASKENAASTTTAAAAATTTAPEGILISKDMEDELGQFKYGWDVIARPSTWAPDCIRVVYPDENATEAAKFGFDFAPDAQHGVLVLSPCRNDANDRMMWTKDWAIRSTRDVCLTVIRADSPVEMRPCQKSDKAQRFALERLGRWKKAGVLRNTDLDLCLIPPAFGTNDRRIRLTPCTTQPRSVCPLLWIVTAEMPTDTEVPAAAVLPSVASVAATLDADPPQRVLAPAPPGKRILCWVMTDPRKIALRALAVNRTWARECDTLLYFSTAAYPGLPMVRTPLNEVESRDTLWRKAQHAWLYLYDHYLDKADWFMRADDDSFVNIDNLRSYLSLRDPAKPHWIGRLLHANGNPDEPFYSGGATSIASRAAMELLGTRVRANRSLLVDYDTFADDLEISLVLGRIGVPSVGNLDESGRQLFLTLGVDFERQLLKRNDPKHWLWAFGPGSLEGRACCSRHWIASHYTSPYEMYALDDLHAMQCEGGGDEPYS